jgi:hypothetical protein
MVASWFPSDVRYARQIYENIGYSCSARKWTPVIAMNDALSIWHVGSAPQDEGLLLQGRRRYVAAIASLREALGQDRLRVPMEDFLLVAMATLMSEVLPQFFPATCMVTR